MRVEKLIGMANQVAVFFRPYPPDEAAASVRKHLVAFWTPAMVAMLEQRVAGEPAGIDPLVLAAMRRRDTPHGVMDKAPSSLSRYDLA